jgi:autophagy-related protein 9
MMHSHISGGVMGGAGGDDGMDHSSIQHHYHAMHEAPPSPHQQHQRSSPQQHLHYGQHDNSNDNNTPYHHPRHQGQHDNMVHHHHDDASTDSSTQLWDQLNDEEARQVQQHESRFQRHPHDSRSNTLNIVVSMAVGTITGIQHRLHVLARDFQRRREREEQASDGYFQGRAAAHRRRRQLVGVAGHHPPPSAFDFDLQFGIEGMHGHEEDHHPINDVENPDTAPPPPKPLQGYPFVMLHDREVPNRQAITNERETWGVVANLDVFLQHLYQYYYHRGLVPMTCKFFVEMFTLLFTLWLSRILLTKVDWKELTTCKDETSCQANWSDYYYHTGNGRTANTILYWIVQGYTVLILAYAAFSTYLFWHNLQYAIQCRYILHDKLGLSERKLQGGALAWDTVVKALADHQQSGLFRTTLASTPLDPLSIAQRILRKDNFLVAFWNQGLMEKCKIGNRYYWSTTIEWCIHNCILNFIFNHKYEVRPSFVLDSDSLQRRLQVCGVVHFILLPFLMLFVTLHFFLRNVYDFKTSKQYMGNSQWSAVAIWQFREWNELPHQLEQRLEPSYEAATQYLSLFGTSEWVAATGKLLVFLGGAVGGVLLVLGVLNDAILLHVQLWGRNLLWYAGIAGLVYSVGKALLPSKEATPSVTRNLFDDMDNALKNVSVYTHYYPESWKGRGWDSNVYKSFKAYFDTKVKLFLWELTSILLAPYILYFRLSTEAPAICEFCLLSKARVTGVGDVCGFSTFDFDLFKDEAWDGRTLGQSMAPSSANSDSQGGPTETLEESVMRTGNLEEATRLHPKPRAREGKMEKSFFTFRAAHPTFKCPVSGQKLMDCVDEYRMASMTRERDLHIKAAARQLETLARLERPNSVSPTWTRSEADLFATKHNTEASNVPPADAGAGSSHLAPDRSPSPFSPGLVASTSPPLVAHAALQGDMHAKSSDEAARSGIATNLPMVSSESIRASSVHSFPDRLSMISPSDPVALPEQNADRQYYWLERFHEHLRQEEQQSQMQQPAALSESRIHTGSAAVNASFEGNQSAQERGDERSEP